MLPPFATDTPTIRNVLEELGKKGGIMDATDEMDMEATFVQRCELSTAPL